MRERKKPRDFWLVRSHPFLTIQPTIAFKHPSHAHRYAGLTKAMGWTLVETIHVREVRARRGARRR